MTSSPAKLRALAAELVANVMWRGAYLDPALESIAGRGLLEPEQRGLLQEMVYGTVRWGHLLLSITDQLLQKPFREKDRDLLALILIGLYQLRFMHMPAHAAINETVAAVDILKKKWARGVVNACLRRYQREQQILDSADPDCSHPEWLVTRLRQAWPDQWRDILEANNQRPPLVLRVNERMGTANAYRDLLMNQGIEATIPGYVSSAIQLGERHPVSHLPDFSQGRVSIQDGGAQLAAWLLDAGDAMRVLDACAAPGGKTAHILERAPECRLTALELHPERLKRIEENLARLHLLARLVTGDARQTAAWWDNLPYDRILIDAPCSGTGVIRRHPDIKHHRRIEDIDDLTLLQAEILDALWPLLAIGGKLLYVTCSILPEENERQIMAFLDRHSDCVSIDLRDRLPGNMKYVHTDNGCQILPGQNDMDGFFYALVEKRV